MLLTCCQCGRHPQDDVVRTTSPGAVPELPGGRVDARTWAYRQCMDRYRRRHQWIAFFDSDEFLMLRDPAVRDLPTFLRVRRGLSCGFGSGLWDGQPLETCPPSCGRGEGW